MFSVMTVPNTQNTWFIKILYICNIFMQFAMMCIWHLKYVNSGSKFFFFFFFPSIKNPFELIHNSSEGTKRKTTTE